MSKSIQKLLKFSSAINHKKFDPSEGYLATVKEDGWNVRFIYNSTHEWEILSSNDNEIASLQWLKPLLANTRFDKEMVFFTEVHNREIPFPIMNGMLNRKYEPCMDIQITLLDYYNPNPHYNTRIAKDRILDLESIVSLFNQNPAIENRFRPVTSLGTVSSLAEMDNLFSKCYDTEEGIVYQKVDHIFAPGKRNLSLIKQKKECEQDLLCIDILHTVGDKNNPSISLIMQNSFGVTFNVVINSHKLQHLFTSDPSAAIGKVHKISGMEILSSGKIRQPVYNYVRLDKQPSDID